MAWDFTSDSSGGQMMNEDLAFDLRIFYAKIAGSHLEDIAIARKQQKYWLYFRALNDLFVIVKHKFKAKSKDESLKEYKKLMGEVVILSNKYKNEFLGKIKTGNGCAELEKALNEVEMFLYEKMSDGNLFGSQRKIPGL